MDQQQTIFDESFDKVEIRRRRDLMPKWLKVYTWVTIGFAAFISVCILLEMTDTSRIIPGDEAAGYWTGTVIAGIIISAIYVAPGLLVWFEVKWAIWFNLILAAIWITTILSIAAIFDWNNLYIGVTILFFIPFWVGLFPIRRRWSKEAVSGRKLRQQRL